MGADSGQLVFVPDELKICKGDSVTWVNNKAGPHNVVFDEDDIPDGVSQESISMDDQLGEEGQTYTKKFDVAGQYGYYYEPHRGPGMVSPNRHIPHATQSKEPCELRAGARETSCE